MVRYDIEGRLRFRKIQLGQPLSSSMIEVMGQWILALKIQRESVKIAPFLALGCGPNELN